MNYFSRTAARNLLLARAGTPTEVLFTKRTNGQPRKMRFRLPVDVQPDEDRLGKGLLVVQEELPDGSRRYRHVNLDAVYEVRVGRQRYTPVRREDREARRLERANRAMHAQLD